MQYVLGIETSCDETGIAIYAAHNHNAGRIVGEALKSQGVHQAYGGVVPELAAREHCVHLAPLLEQALSDARLHLSDISAIAYTKGPGLAAALLTGAAFAQGLAHGLNIPAVGVHHMEGHLVAATLADPAIQPPFISLLVSGGHTLLVHVAQWGQYDILGESVDDAAGEAFDKVAKMLGLGYPGGKALSELAEKGAADKFKLTPPMLKKGGLNFSFSGLKTQTRLVWLASDQTKTARANLARAFEDTMVATLAHKLRAARRQFPALPLVVAGGVAANRALRAAFLTPSDNGHHQASTHFAPLTWCGDNGAMIAYAGYLRLARHANHQHHVADTDCHVRARWRLDELRP